MTGWGDSFVPWVEWLLLVEKILFVLCLMSKSLNVSFIRITNSWNFFDFNKISVIKFS